MSARLLIVVNSAKFFLSHRVPIARAAREAGFEVHVATPDAPEAKRIADLGFSFHPVPFQRGRIGPVAELRTLVRLARLYQAVRPDVVHHVTLKPAFLGTIAARAAKVPAVVNAITGLGYLFVDGGVRARVLRAAFLLSGRFGLRHPAARFIFQNAEDSAELVRSALVRPDEAVLIRGSGVDTHVFAPAAERPGAPLVVLPSRMLWQKGVGEFVEAARLLRARGCAARFALVGDSDAGNPECVPPGQLERWAREGAVEWWGFRSDMPAVLAASHLVVLPSFYREGVPKALIEAAAAGRAIVTTDMPGCRDIVRDGVNGLLVAPRTVEPLAAAIGRLLAKPELRREMGLRGRELVVREFAVERVVEETLGVYRALLPGAP